VLGAAIAIMDLHRQQRQRQIGRLEGLLARHWPELLAVVKLGSATQLSLLSNIGGPAQVAARPDQATQLLMATSQGMLKPAVIDAVLESAQRSIGMPLCAAELELLQVLSVEALQTLERYQRAAARVSTRSIGRRGVSAQRTWVQPRGRAPRNRSPRTRGARGRHTRDGRADAAAAQLVPGARARLLQPRVGRLAPGHRNATRELRPTRCAFSGATRLRIGA
jgi:hypothetical protein